MLLAHVRHKEFFSILDNDDQPKAIFNTLHLDNLQVPCEIITTAIYYLVIHSHMLIYQFATVSCHCHLCIYSISNFYCYQIQDVAIIFICILRIILLVAPLLLSTRHFHRYFDQYFSHHLSNFNLDDVDLIDIFCFVFLDLLVGNLENFLGCLGCLDAIIPMVASIVSSI